MWSQRLFSPVLRQATRNAPNTVRTSASLLPRRPAVAFLLASAQRQQLRLLSDQTRQNIEKLVGSHPVVLFMKGSPEMPQCGFSRAVIQILGLQGVDPAKFQHVNILENDEIRSGIKEFSEWPTIPQLYVDKEFIGGCDILLTMHQDGSLAKLLEEKDALVPLEAPRE